MAKYFYLSFLLIASCASDSGVVAMGNDTYIIAKQAATGFPGTGGIRTEALQEASEYCLSNNQAVEIVSETQSRPPYLLGNYPRVEVTFKCVAIR